MKKILVLFIAAVSSLPAQNFSDSHLSGNLQLDKHIVQSAVPLDGEKLTEYNNLKKSPLLGGLMSFAVPGAGQIYSKSYWKAAIFMAVEAAAITVGLIYDKKGDNQTASFEAFADDNWSVAQYAQFTFDNLDRLNSAIFNDPDKMAYYNGNLFIDDAHTQVNWTVLNQLESDIGGYYSHRLAPYQDQQYYEMIGKYPQFNPGWSDFDNPDYTYGDPLTENFRYYSSERGKANDYYNVASKAVVIIIINHVLSAADAAWSAAGFNKDLKVRLGLEKQQIGFYYEYYPSLNVRVRL